MENQHDGKHLTGSKIYDELPAEFKNILDKACHAAYKAGYSEGYEDGKAGHEDHSRTEEQNQPADHYTGRKWKGKESESWKWI